jgi:orotidine-5'-phosphate decarboxylase
MAPLKPRVIVALDYPSLEDAMKLVDELGDLCEFYKVGSELFVAAGPEAVRTVRSLGKEVFLDLKLHDIPNTVRHAARACAALGASLITVHASGGGEMIRAAVEGSGSSCAVLVVTVLTSLHREELGEIWARPVDHVPAEVLRLAGLARAAGAAGIVCAGSEVTAVKNSFGEMFRVVVPGVRFAGATRDDQSRVVTPAAAARAGADFLVVGRAVTGASDPRGALQRVLAEMEEGCR